MGQQAAVTGMECPGTGKTRALKAARFAVAHLGMCSLHPDRTHVYVSTRFVEIHQVSGNVGKSVGSRPHSLLADGSQFLQPRPFDTNKLLPART